MTGIALKRLENMMGKIENAPFPTMFQKVHILGLPKTCGYGFRNNSETVKYIHCFSFSRFAARVSSTVKL